MSEKSDKKLDKKLDKKQIELQTKIIEPGSVIGVFGGGQLGRMSALAAAKLGYKVHIYTDQKDSPASQVSFKTTVAKYNDKEALEKFAKAVDVVTFEFENIPHDAVKLMEKHGVPVRPGWKILHIIQNRIREKEFLNSMSITTTPFIKVTSAKTLEDGFKKIGTKCVLKTSEFGYDGKGQCIIDENTKFAAQWKKMATKEAILEGFIDFEKELSVIVCRGIDGGAIPYMPVVNLHKDGILDTTIAPADLPQEIIESAWDIAHDIADEMDLVGVLAVEFFLTKDGELLVNELAPRPHNSGHWTLDACITSQFEQHIRTVCGISLGSTDYHSRAIMKNLIGDEVELWKQYISEPDVKLHIYGKNEAKAGRKMGHVTHVIAPGDVIIDSEE